MSIAAPITAFYASLLSLITGIGTGVVMLGDAILGLLHINRRVRTRIWQQMAFVGFGSLPIVLVTMLFGGMVLAFQSSKQLVQFGASQYVGSIVSISMARELAPTLTAMIVAARIGSAFAAELGTMRITNQVDALRALATNPIRYLVTPRLLATVVMLPILTLYANLAGDLGGALVSQSSGGVSFTSFFDSAQAYLKVYDINAGLIKAAVFGIIICITSCYMGLRTEGGATGVGKSTTSAVVWSIIFIYAMNFLLAWLLYAFRD
jgi:phospholipid/cholesterol/gamma-HCH transport system permease protein